MATLMFLVTKVPMRASKKVPHLMENLLSKLPTREIILLLFRPKTPRNCTGETVWYYDEKFLSNRNV